jgi:hypothetical protein
VKRPWLFDSEEEEDHKLAAKFCDTCPVFEWCEGELAKAMEDHGYYAGPRGTWAGQFLTTRTPSADVTAKHGTDKGYYHHRRIRTVPCDRCKRAHTDAEKARVIRRAVEAERKRRNGSG